MTIDMPVCEHLTPIKFSCLKCNRIVTTAEDMNLAEGERVFNIDLSSLFQRIEILENSLNETMKCVGLLADRLYSISELIENAKNAESLFAKKVHELQSIDKKRDDVINALCQKVEALHKHIDSLMIVQLSEGQFYGATSR
jgi:hypothetical protein